jgi:hypothetical protein
LAAKAPSKPAFHCHNNNIRSTESNSATAIDVKEKLYIEELASRDH